GKNDDGFSVRSLPGCRRSRHRPVEKQSSIAEMRRDLAVRGNDPSCACQGFGFGFDKPLICTKIAEGRTLRMQFRRPVKPRLDLRHRECGHQNVECPAAEMARPPKKRKKILLDGDVKDIEREPPCVTSGQLLVHRKQIELACGPLSGELSRAVRTKCGDI